MKHIELFEGFFDRFKSKSNKDEKPYEYYGEEGDIAPSTENNDDVYAIMTQELIDRNKDRKHVSLAHYGYHFFYRDLEKLKKLKEDYPVGGTYKGETITQVATFNSRDN